MAQFEIIMPKMGESIIEATITKWLYNEGDTIKEDDAIVEVATDKVDSEVPSPVEGVIKEFLYKEGDIAEVGSVIAIIEVEQNNQDNNNIENYEEVNQNSSDISSSDSSSEGTEDSRSIHTEEIHQGISDKLDNSDDRFYSPLVKSIAKEENISSDELSSITGTGLDGRVTKRDILYYLDNRDDKKQPNIDISKSDKPKQNIKTPEVSAQKGDTVLEMDRMRKLIAEHMVMSKEVSPHVTMFIDVDVTNIVKWRDRIKKDFLKREGEKITYTPIFIEAVAKMLKQYPNVNASVDGNNIIQRGNVNVGMATALPDGNLIVPVIKDADQKNLLGLTKSVNQLAQNARNKKLEADDVAGGTFSITNLGGFDSITGTPIINQPQVAILGIGAIKKQPVVKETKDGDVIAIRHICILSMAFDHRIVDGALGGMFLKSLKEELENFDINRTI